MKKLYLIALLLPLLGLSQVQIGDAIKSAVVSYDFGNAVAISDDGQIVAIGDWQDYGNGTRAGCVKVYENIAGSWYQIGANIQGENVGDKAGIDVAISADGTIVAIGAMDYDGIDYNSIGQVKVFENQNGSWVLLGEPILGQRVSEQSGRSVSLSSDGTIVAIGGPEQNSGSVLSDRRGRVRVFEYVNNSWVQIGNELVGDNLFDRFGWSVSLSSNGMVLAAGAPNNDENGENSGQVSVYENQGGNWVQIGQSIHGEAQGDESGRSISLSGDGSRLVIGAWKNDGNGGGSGHVRIYENANGNWLQMGDDIDGEDPLDKSGFSVSISRDGNTLAIGSPDNIHPEIGPLQAQYGGPAGQVRVYRLTEGEWVKQWIDINSEAYRDKFGSSVALSADGDTLIAGATDAELPPIWMRGHARVFDLAVFLSLATQDHKSTGLKLYPNPTKDQFTIQLNNSSDLRDIHIYNNLGQLVLTSKETTVDTSKLALGLYLVEVETARGKSIKKLIIE
ncbi:T9SS type A sorting domain-containing protein [Winogradskyella sp.]|uniref:T9SS type A sorting domain-containing protein n=1 Tax=Winogradskyella sp. TaxID=1883156 RepID=UPI0026117BD7|nr:T9SS type A sorting domain-containing protein [Winogradskyella sp.]